MNRRVLPLGDMIQMPESYSVSVSNAERRTANAERRTPNGERRTANGERRTPNIERRHQG